MLTACSLATDTPADLPAQTLCPYNQLSTPGTPLWQRAGHLKTPCSASFPKPNIFEAKGLPDTPYLSPPAIAWFSFLGAGVFFMYLFDVVEYLLWSQKPDIPSKSLDTHPLANDCRGCPRISSPSHFPMFLQEHSTTDGVPEMPLWSLSTQTPNSFTMVHVKPAQQHPNTRAVLQEACPTLPSSFSRV